MTQANYPTSELPDRRADQAVQFTAFVMIITGGGALMATAWTNLDGAMILALAIYVLCALASNLSSATYHFSPFHDWRKKLRRLDHSAIYVSITGMFTPLFVLADTTWSWALLAVCWVLTGFAVWRKITGENVKSRWSTASYLALGALGLSALLGLDDAPAAMYWFICAAAASYAVGTIFYAREDMSYRYAIWHGWVNFGTILMFAGIWLAVF